MNEKDEARLKLLAGAEGLAIIDLDLAICIDELAIGFSLGVLGLPLVDGSDAALTLADILDHKPSFTWRRAQVTEIVPIIWAWIVQ